VGRGVEFRRIVVIVVLVLAGALVGVGLLARSVNPPSDNPYLADQLRIGAFFVPVGAYVAWRRPEHRLGWLVLAIGVLYWATGAGQPGLEWLVIHRPGWELLVRAILAVGISTWLVGRGILLALVPLCYPDRAPQGRLGATLWVTGSASIAVAALAHSRLYTPAYFEGAEPTGLARVAQAVEPWAWRVVLVTSVIAIVSMVVRVARLPVDQRRRHLPVAATAAVLVVPALSSFYAEFAGHDLLSWSEDILVWTAVAFPCVLLYGVVRHGVLDMSVVVRRSTVYALTALALAAVYAAVTWAATTAISTGGTSQVVATAGVALIAMPVYSRIHHLVDRWLFGSHRDPAGVLVAIGTTVEQAPQGTVALELVATTLRRELRLPYVAVDLDIATDADTREPLTVRAASAGVPTGDVESFDLVDTAGRIGALVVARRTPHEAFRPDERAALQGIAHHVAVLASNVALTEQLITSQRRLVTTREEERRRIRRDLHDGLGPTLASVCLGLGAACERIGNDTELGAFLTQLEDELHAAVDGIRQLVYDLRPPALDEFGLVGAVREHVATLASRSVGGTEELELHVDSTDVAAELPAAVEVAAYRIALEAITNVSRHALANHCWVRINGSADALHLEIEDDGRGMDTDRRAGVGLRSMRDRATELGGELFVKPRAPHGTLIRASLPLALSTGSFAS
jgi:signal transduction histidine kinase